MPAHFRKLPPFVTAEYVVNLTDDFVSADVPAGSFDAVERALFKLRDVTEVCMGHQVWVTIVPRCKTFDAHVRACVRTYSKARDIIHKHGGN